MPEIIRDPLAQVKAYPACSLILASVESGISVFKYTRQVFRAYADAGIPDAQNTCLIHVYFDTALRRVLYSIGNDLFYDKRQPFLICQDSIPGRGVVKRQLFKDELSCELADRRLYDLIKIILSDQIVCIVRIQPEVCEDHLNILFDPVQVSAESPGCFRVLGLQSQPHCRNRSLDLVRPYSIVLHHIAELFRCSPR